MHIVIRRYSPSDKQTVIRLFSTGIKEHIWPCYQNAMTSPLYLVITLFLCIAGYLLGSVYLVLVLLVVWCGLIYFCCHRLYSGYVEERCQTDMQDIVGNYLSRPDDCFWVAEAEVDGRSKILGMVAVMSKYTGGEKHAEMFRMIISQEARRKGLGSRMTQHVIDFCKEKGFTKLVLETSSTQNAAVALYKKHGFTLVMTHTETHASPWITYLTRVTILKMEKQL